MSQERRAAPAPARIRPGAHRRAERESRCAPRRASSRAQRASRARPWRPAPPPWAPFLSRAWRGARRAVPPAAGVMRGATSSSQAAGSGPGKRRPAHPRDNSAHARGVVGRAPPPLRKGVQSCIATVNAGQTRSIVHHTSLRCALDPRRAQVSTQVLKNHCSPRGWTTFRHAQGVVLACGNSASIRGSSAYLCCKCEMTFCTCTVVRSGTHELSFKVR